MSAPDRVLVVGGGIGGVSTVAALRAGGYAGDLTLVDAGEFPYDRPPLSKAYLAGTAEAKQLALQPPAWYDEQAVRLVTGVRATRLSPATGEVALSDGTTLRPDRVVLATGGGAARPPIPGADSPRVHVLRTLDDADRLRPVLTGGGRLLAVGAGLIGAEVASTAAELGCQVVLADPVAPPLAAAVGPELAEWLHADHAGHGIEVVQGAVTALAETAAGITARLGGEDADRTFDAVLLAVGLRPETALAEEAGLTVDRGIVVDPGHVTSNPAVLAVGDPVRVRSGTGVAPRAEHWEAAAHQGQRAAATLLGLPAPEPTAPWFWTDRHQRHVEAVGHMAAASDTVVRGALGGDRVAVFGLHEGRVVAVAAVDDPTSIRAARRMIDRAVPVDATELADPAVDLRKLLRRAPREGQT